MCGIIAIVNFDGSVREDILREMTSTLCHRGPDGQSIWKSADELAGLGHTRLAVIDLETGDQPIHSPCGRYSIVLNGEIYNYRQLREELGKSGQSFRTNSDTEVLLASYIAWGADCLTRLNGMFAFAIYDSERRSLFVARDRTGIKPLFLFRDSQRVIVASEIKALLKDKTIPRKLNPRAVADLLILSYCQVPSTFYKDIFELPPGTWSLFTEGAVDSRRYWKWCREPIDCKFDSAVSGGKEALIQSVADHLVSDVPVGAFLSSGVDSSLVSAIAVKELGYKLQTFTVGFDFEDYDESNDAKRIARHIGTDHHTLLLNSKNVTVDLLLTVLKLFDQPFGDSSAIPTYILSSLIADKVKVVLSGDGGDEMFGGYPRFFHADLTHRIAGIFGRAARLGYPMAWLLSLINARLGRASTRMLNATMQNGTDRLTWFATHVTNEELIRVLSPQILLRLEDYRPSIYPGSRAGDPDGSDLIDATVDTVLPSDYLRKMDIASSAHGLEVRVPFLGNQVLDFAQTIPKSHLYHRMRTKLIPRALLKEYLPDGLCDLPKSGFNIPLMRVLSEPDRRILATKLNSSKELHEVIAPSYITEISNAFVNRKWNKAKYSEYMLYQRFYALLALLVWIEECKPEI